MDRSREINTAQDEYARLLGYITMEAGAIEFYIRSLAVTLHDDHETGKRILEGARTVSQWADATKRRLKEEADELTPELLSSLLAAIAEAKSALREEGDLSHSVWITASIFDERPEPMRISMRGHREEKIARHRLDRVLERLRRSHEELKSLFENIYWANPWGLKDYL